jgi:hypothetical protein
MPVVVVASTSMEHRIVDARLDFIGINPGSRLFTGVVHGLPVAR